MQPLNASQAVLSCCCSHPAGNSFPQGLAQEPASTNVPQRELVTAPKCHLFVTPYLNPPTLPGMALSILALPPTRTELIPSFLLSCPFALSSAISAQVLPTPSAHVAIPNHL